MEKDGRGFLAPARLFVRNCRTAPFQPKIADSTGVELTAGKILTGALVMKRLLEREVLEEDERTVGILLPPSAGAAVVNAALSLKRTVVVNLNYTLSNEDVNYCIRQAGIRHVLTSGKFLERRPFDLDAEVVLLEKLRERVTLREKLTCAALAYLCPPSWLESMLKLDRIHPDDLLTIVFTSGSTGEPKGVMLTQRNIGSNIEAVCKILRIKNTDVLMGVLPFFHSFGYTVTLWLALALKPKVVYHYNPLDAKVVGELCQKHGVTILIATPTFLRTYLKRCTKEQFWNVNLVVLGAEKMPLELARQFEKKFGVMPSEGYGTTELSPVVSVNIPESRRSPDMPLGTKLGSVGKPLPGIQAKTVDPETGQDLPVGQEGLLLIKGPNVMKGYLNQPEKTAEVLKDGWYNTGDIARVDEDGFIYITGRQSRFAKIGGEMVPLIRVENELLKIVGQTDEDGAPPLVVTSVPDEKKGERLVVLYTTLPKPIPQILEEMAATGLPNLWIPSADSFFQVDEIPILGSGKYDLKRIKQKALEAANLSSSQPSTSSTQATEPDDEK